MANNGPISVSSPNVSLSTATASQIIFTTKYPFAKLDTTNLNSFTVLTILLTKDVANPASVNNTATTLIYSYAHGYTYVPSTWFLMSIDGFKTVSGQENGFIYGANSSAGVSSVTLTIVVDAVNVNFYANKFWGGVNPSPPNITGTVITIRSYVFVEDLLGQSVPASA